MDLYCVTCGKLARCVVNDHMHLIPERAFAVCEGPLIVRPPVEAGPSLFSHEEAEHTDNPFTFDDFRFDPYFE